MGTRELEIDTFGVNLLLVNFTALDIDLWRLAFSEEQNIQIVGCASNPADLRTILSQQTPEVALVDSRGGKSDPNAALALLEQTASSAPSVKQIVILKDAPNDNVITFFRSGAKGILSESQVDHKVVIKCIRCVKMGQIWANSGQLNQLVQALSLPRALKITNVMGKALLSKREEEVLHYLADGMSNREIADTLKLSEHTIKNHLFRIFDKLGVSNRMEAVLYAMSQRDRGRELEILSGIFPHVLFLT